MQNDQKQAIPANLPEETVKDTHDVTKREFQSVTSGNLQEWIDQLEQGITKEIVTSEGSRFSFNNDGGNHYLELIDVTRKEPNGRYKRVYKGKIEGSHVSYKSVTSDLEPLTEYIRWCKTPYGSKGRVQQTERKDEGLPSKDEGFTSRLATEYKERDYASTIHH